MLLGHSVSSYTTQTQTRNYLTAVVQTKSQLNAEELLERASLAARIMTFGVEIKLVG